MMEDIKLRRQATAVLVILAVQFLAGMLLNLFVTLPDKHPGSSGSMYFSRSWHSLAWALSGHGGWGLAIHAYLALGLVLGTLSLFVNAVMHHSRSWIMLGGIAALFTVGAFFNGLSFIDYNKDVSSMIMAIGWLVAAGALIFGLTRTGVSRTKQKRA